MAGMARTNSASPFQGFSVFQTELGAQLQFLPALGTPELDTLIDAFLPGPASIKDKRAMVVMDFCEYAKRTGQNFKYYPVYASAAAATDSPASSAAMYDSGYASSYNASPAVSDAAAGMWGGVFAPSTPSSHHSHTKHRSSASSSQRKSSVASSSKAAAAAGPKDFSHLPGMKIMTKDGQDVTNSASRGCKTKEQRDHAHLMRIIKACDACRRKKIRCDPSHKKRSAASSQAQSPAEPRPSKKSKKTAAEAPPPVLGESDINVGGDSFHWDVAAALPAEDLLYTDPFVEESWENFVHFDEDVPALPVDYDFHFDPESYFSPGSGSSQSPSSQPFTPAPPGPSPVDVYSGALLPEPDGQAAQLPYLSAGLHGTNYIDFNLYSPPAGFLDEEPLQLQTTKTSRPKSSRARSPGIAHASQNHTGAAANGLAAQSSTSPAAAESYFCGCAEDQQQRRQSVPAPEPGWRVPGDRSGLTGELNPVGQHTPSTRPGRRQAGPVAHSTALAAAAPSQPGSPLSLAAYSTATLGTQQQSRRGDRHSQLVSSGSCSSATISATAMTQTIAMTGNAVVTSTGSVATSAAKGHRRPHDNGSGQDELSTAASSSPASSRSSPPPPPPSVSVPHTYHDALAEARQSPAADRRRVAARSSEDEQGGRSRGIVRQTLTGSQDHYRDHHKEDLVKRGNGHRVAPAGVADSPANASLHHSAPAPHAVSREGKLGVASPSDTTVARPGHGRRGRTSLVSGASSSSSSVGGRPALPGLVLSSSARLSCGGSTIPPTAIRTVADLDRHYKQVGDLGRYRRAADLDRHYNPEQQQPTYGGAAVALTAALLLSTLPIRQLVDGLRSAPVAAVVAIGLVSLLASALLILAPSLPSGILSDILLSKVPTAALVLAPLGIQHHSSQPPSSSSSSLSLSWTCVHDAIENVKLRAHRAAESVDGLRCVVARRLARRPLAAERPLRR